MADRLGDIDARAVNSIPIGVDDEDLPVVARVGQYGPYLERGRLGGHRLDAVTAGVSDESGRWRPTASSGQRMRRHPVGVSTGREVVIVGHRETPSGPLLGEPIDGAAYDPASDSWRTIPESTWVGVPAAAVWAGDQMLVVGGDGGGAAFDPSTDSWRNLPPEVTTPTGFRAAVWTGQSLAAFGWDSQGIEGVLFDPDTGQTTTVPTLESKLSDDTQLLCAAGEIMLWDRNGGWFYDPAGSDWRPAPKLGTFDGKKPTWARVAAVAGEVLAVAWFRTTSKIRVARLDGPAGDDQEWTWLPDTEIDGDLAEIQVVQHDGDPAGALIIIDDDIPTKAYRFRPSATSRSATRTSPPARSAITWWPRSPARWWCSATWSRPRPSPTTSPRTSSVSRPPSR